MKEEVFKEKYKIEEYLHESLDQRDKQIDYILYKENPLKFHTMCSNGYEGGIEFTPYTGDEFSYVSDYDYNFDYYIFNLLEEDWNIGFMTPETHYNLWNSIQELYPTDIDYKKGLDNYIKYCIDNKITKEFIDKEVNLDVPNIIDKFESLKNYHRQLDDYFYVLDVGYRKDQPVALVERTTEYGKDYLIAFNYEIENNKISWGYGYYYDTNLDKAKKDFGRVLNGENLSKTFEREDGR